MTKSNLIRVYIVNTASVGTACGYGVGRTLEMAQLDALRVARQNGYNDPKLSKNGHEVLVTSPVYC